MDKIKKVWRIIAIIVILFGLTVSFIMQVWVKPDIANPIGRVLGYFDYFTQWSNIFAVLWLINDTLLNNKIKFLSKRSVRGAINLYVWVAGAVFWLILNAQWHQVGWDRVETCILHGFTPVVFFLDWLFFYQKGTYKFKDIPKWEIFPIGYMIFAIVMGKITTYFPYSFFNIDKMDVSQFLSSMKFVVLGFIVFGIIIVCIDKLCSAVNKVRGKVYLESERIA